MNFDMNQIRSVTRGEVNGSTRFVAGAFFALVVWVAATWLSDMAKSASSALALQQANYHTLSQLAAEYNILTAQASPAGTGTVDVMTSFTQISARIGLGSRVSRIVPTPDGRRCTVDINRLYAEELTEMVRELADRGIQVLSAEIRALPAGQERLFTVTVVIGREV